MSNSRVVPLLGLIVALNIFFFYINPTWSGSISKLNAAIAADNTALAAADTYKSEQNDLITQRNNISSSDQAALVKFLPNAVNNVHIILDLNALASRSQLSISNINVISNSENATNGSAATGGSPIGTVDLSVSAIGTFDALQNFLAGVEKSQRLLDVESLAVKGSDTGVYNYQMTIRLYWLH